MRAIIRHLGIFAAVLLLALCAAAQNVAPAAVSVTPNSGGSITQTFAFLFSDANGVNDLASLFMNINTTNTYVSACGLSFYNPTNRVTIINDAGTGWSAPITIGTAGTLENSQCSVNLGASSVSKVGNDLTVNLAITFKPAFTGARNIYLKAIDSSGLMSSWLVAGAWVGPTAPTAVAVSPSSGQGTAQAFAFHYSDPNGASDLTNTFMNINLTNTYVSACGLSYYDPTSRVRIINDDGAAWSAPLTIGTAGTLQNSQCSVDLGASSVSKLGNDLTVNLAVTFKPAFAGTKNVFLKGVDQEAMFSAWLNAGAWSTLPPGPTITGAPTAAGRGDSITITGTNFHTPAGTLALNGAPAQVTAWSDTSISAYVPDTASASGSLVVTTNDYAQTANTAFTVNPPTLTSISPTQGVAGTLVTLTGTGLGRNPGSCAVLFAATPSPGQPACNVTSIPTSSPTGLPDGLVQVGVTIGGTPSSNTLSFTVLNPMLLTPSEMTLVVGETQPLQALNSDGTGISGVSWSVDNTGIATVADDGQGNFTLTAVAAGTATLTGTSGTRSGTATVTVVQLAAGETLPAGTKRWVAPPLGPRTVQNIVQARVVDENTPDFYAEEAGNGMGSVIRAFTATGQQKWTWTPPVSQTSSEWLAGDNSGGLLTVTNSADLTTMTVHSVNQAGQQTWAHALPLAYGNNYVHAVAADGTVFVQKRYDDLSIPVQIVALDGATGQESYSISLPQSTRTWSDGSTAKEFTDVGSFVIDDTGALWTSVVVNTFTQSPIPPQYHTCTSTLNTVKVVNGTATITQIDSATFGPSSQQLCGTSKQFEVAVTPVIPDGSGGIVLAASKPTATTPSPTIYRSNGAPIASPVGTVSQMLLGENDTIFLRGSTGRAKLSLDGTPQWQDGGTGSLAAALGDGSLLVENGTLKRINSSGQEADFSAGSAMSLTSQYGGDLWAGATATGTLSLTTSSMASADPAADFVWWLARTIANRMAGNAQKQNAPTVEVPVKVLHVTGTPGTQQFIAGQVDAASRLWSYHGIELSWDRTIQDVPSCDPVAYPNGCDSNLQLDIAALTTLETAQEIARRFCDASGTCFGGKRVGLIFNDRVSMGLGNANGWTAFSGSTDSPRFWNLSVIPAYAEGNDTGHEIGHQFQLTHQTWVWPNNLMCSNVLCPEHPGAALSPDQVKTAHAAAEKLK